jgi:AraC family transcriptional regulator of adaptative response / DNA-3-methyladenine glycosylase II
VIDYQTELTSDQMYAVVQARDAAYNGRFFVGVVTTGIYCLPSCRSRTPHQRNVRFFETTAAAREAGLRACKRCQPDRFEPVSIRS